MPPAYATVVVVDVPILSIYLMSLSSRNRITYRLHIGLLEARAAATAASADAEASRVTEMLPSVNFAERFDKDLWRAERLNETGKNLCRHHTHVPRHTSRTPSSSSSHLFAEIITTNSSIINHVMKFNRKAACRES